MDVQSEINGRHQHKHNSRRLSRVYLHGHELGCSTCSVLFGAAFVAALCEIIPPFWQTCVLAMLITFAGKERQAI
ncbi:uncharacterized protein MEPE_06711 [Melanopsichium pennsylvanicum]|uniref:Uncharacterized protein n=1 Tax=Melanopsichium pennsylvanicum TaxID=63383 RepID=A0AAJ4XSY8_9BASI|nr:uncharacterized protein MEPE_06711 [Melanopsichium pennsylvanicum]